MGDVDREVQALRARSEEADRLAAELKESVTENARIEGLYRTEQASTRASL